MVAVDDETICAILGCGKPHFGNGLCRAHWRMVRRHPYVLRKAMREIDTESFMKHVDVRDNDECWEWKGRRDPAGYGIFHVSATDVRAHRFSAFRFSGEKIDGLVVRHKCDNPPCVNPTHLEVGSIADNNRDVVLRSRRAPVSHCPSGHEMTEANTKTWVTRDGYTARTCRECAIKRVREWRAQKGRSKK